MAQCGTCVSRLYKSVIEDVINGVKESFLDEGIDDQILTELQTQWEAKLAAANVVNHVEGTVEHQNRVQQQQNNSKQPSNSQNSSTGPSISLVPIQITIPSQQAGGVGKTITIHAPSSALAAGIAGPQLQSILSSPAAAQTFALETTQAAEIIQRQLNVALQQNGVILPPQLLQFNAQVDGPCDQPLSGYSIFENVNDFYKNEPNLLESVVPQNMKRPLKKSPLESATCESDGLLVNKPLSMPVTFEKTNSSKTCNITEVSIPSTSKTNASVPSKLADNITVQTKASRDTMDNILKEGLTKAQLDGAHGLGDSSEEMSDSDDSENDEFVDVKDDDTRGGSDLGDDDEIGERVDEAPLNSDDDVSEDEATEVFETENVIVCQYDKITRVRNKWKFHLKDGIMHLKSKDYVFTKANGEGEW